MTRAEAERALEIARNALREVGMSTQYVRVAPLTKDPTRWTLRLSSQRPWLLDQWRAAAIGIAAVKPAQRIACWDHMDRDGRDSRDRCGWVAVYDVVAGTKSCQAVTA